MPSAVPIVPLVPAKTLKARTQALSILLPACPLWRCEKSVVVDG